MAKTGTKGQAEIMDGLILLLVAAITSVVLLSISSNYGVLPGQIYEQNYAQKLAQNALLSLYHITYLDNPEHPLYKKSIMVGVSQRLSSGSTDLRSDLDNPAADGPGQLLWRVLNAYHDELGWHFMFAITTGDKIRSDSVISTDDRVVSEDTFNQYAGSRSCASSVLTYPAPITGGCHDFGGSTESMCYVIFEICTWLS